ncbi:hypothetical protein L7F22_006129 [Adiantum nelumboides]|nr:hypothetical protein [Adiantum nelumboides]
MGDLTELNREVGHAHFRSSEVGGFHFSACESKVGSFHFEVGHHIDALGNPTETSISASHGVEAFFELSDAAKAFCEADLNTIDETCRDVHAFCEEGDELIMGWVSPRISFSQDLAMEETTAQNTSRAFPEKRKREGGEENGELNDGYSSEFEFLSNGVSDDGVVCQSKAMMLPADELFSDGKLLPMHVQEVAFANGDLGMQGSKLLSVCGRQMEESRGNEPRIYSGKLTLHAEGRNAAEARERVMARNLSLDLPRTNSSSTNCGLAPLVSLSVDNSPCSSLPRSLTPPSNACIETSSASPALQKTGSKYTFKIKDFFKPNRVSSPSSPQLTRDNSTTSISTCRIPIPPRAFWPFSRSNSAGESKTALPSLPPRSNSAGERNASREITTKFNEARILELNKNSCIPHRQDYGAAAMAPANEDESQNIATYEMHVNSARDYIDVGSSSSSTEILKKTGAEEECAPSRSSQKQHKQSQRKIIWEPRQGNTQKVYVYNSKFSERKPWSTWGNELSCQGKFEQDCAEEFGEMQCR